MLQKFLKSSPRTNQGEEAGDQLVLLNELSVADLVIQAAAQKLYRYESKADQLKDTHCSPLLP